MPDEKTNGTPEDGDVIEGIVAHVGAARKKLAVLLSTPPASAEDQAKIGTAFSNFVTGTLGYGIESGLGSALSWLGDIEGRLQDVEDIVNGLASTGVIENTEGVGGHDGFKVFLEGVQVLVTYVKTLPEAPEEVTTRIPKLVENMNAMLATMSTMEGDDGTTQAAPSGEATNPTADA